MSKSADSSTGQALYKAILDNPDDVGAYGVYGDWLQEQQDPRGEFIALQLMLEDERVSTRERKKLQKREQELLDAHQREWLGELAPYLIDQQGVGDYWVALEQSNWVLFRRGFIDTIHIQVLTVNLARILVRSKQTGLLRNLVIEFVDYEGDNSEPYEPGNDLPAGEITYIALYPLLRSRYLGNIRRFQLGEDQGDEFANFGSSGFGIPVVDLVRKMRRLEELILFAQEVDLHRLFRLKCLPNLRVLKLYHLDEYPLEILSSNRHFAGLTNLQLHPHHHRRYLPGYDDDPQAYITFDHLRAIVRSKHLKNLTHLQLRVSDLGDRGCKEIVKSGILKRLKVLDLRHGCITDEGAKILANSGDLANLEHLDVDRNALTSEGINALTATGVNLRASNQQNAQEIAEYQFLFEGDFE